MAERKRTSTFALVGVLAAATGLVLLLLWSYHTDGVAFQFLRDDLDSVEKMARLKHYFAQWGGFAPIVYIVVVMVEVIVVPIPGAILYAPGGVIFGGLVGGLLALVGNVLGAGVSYLLMKWLGGVFLQRLKENETLQEYQSALQAKGLWIVFLLRVNPLTSSDLVSYAAGLTSIRLWQVMVGTCLGMAPLCIAQAYFAESVVTVFPWLIYPLACLCLVYAAGVLWLIHRQSGRPSPP